MSGEPSVRLDPRSAVPPFEQVRQQIAELIRIGVLRPDERLPSVRQLAGDLGLAAGTVARAYQELEAAGLVTTGRGAGTRVAAAPPLAPADRREALAEHAEAYVRAGRRLAATDEELLAAIHAALD
ncbi:GntR family transcriptional regulator [Catellatospora sp. NPDC049609]|uniref:GntR family transcriptional regulator n=1 Tax=Catellatospora sp. NPDC049609 TaxID=3155505 RepID=UPI003417768E